MVADDKLCRRCHTTHPRPIDTVICTIDKDLLMCEGEHYNWVTGVHRTITTIMGLRFFYKQLLQGDATDNIPGLYRLTGVKCTKPILNGIDVLQTEKDFWEYVMGTYNGAWESRERQGKTRQYPDFEEAQLVEIARLLWMSRGDVDDWHIPK